MAHARYVRIAVGTDLRYAVVEHEAGGERLRLLDGPPWLGGRPTADTTTYDARTPTLAPVSPSKIVAIGSNYRAHILEMGRPIPDEPVLFLKPPSSIVGSGDAIVRPEGYERTDFEGELGVVMGKRCRHVAQADALSYVFGYTICNDVTVRDLQKRDIQFTRAKGFDTFCPIGPAVVVANGTEGTIIDPGNLHLTTRVNGEVKQDSSTSDLIFDVPTLIAFISGVMTLEPGDVISTGTPSGVGPIVPGDRVEIEISGIGVLVNRVVAPG